MPTKNVVPSQRTVDPIIACHLPFSSRRRGPSQKDQNARAGSSGQKLPISSIKLEIRMATTENDAIRAMKKWFRVVLGIKTRRESARRRYGELFRKIGVTETRHLSQKNDTVVGCRQNRHQRNRTEQERNPHTRFGGLASTMRRAHSVNARTRACAQV